MRFIAERLDSEARALHRIAIIGLGLLTLEVYTTTGKYINNSSLYTYRLGPNCLRQAVTQLLFFAASLKSLHFFVHFFISLFWLAITSGFPRLCKRQMASKRQPKVVATE